MFYFLYVVDEALFKKPSYILVTKIAFLRTFYVFLFWSARSIFEFLFLPHSVLFFMLPFPFTFSIVFHASFSFHLQSCFSCFIYLSHSVLFFMLHFYVFISMFIIDFFSRNITNNARGHFRQQCPKYNVKSLNAKKKKKKTCLTSLKL